MPLPIRVALCLLLSSTWALTGVPCFGAAQDASAAPTERPNIVVFLVDDMGLMDTSTPFLVDESGRPQSHPLNQFYRTPNMQRLAERGVRFSQFYAMSVCSPTRVSLLTGQNAARHRTTNWINPDKDNRGPHGPPDWNWRGLTADSVTLPRILRQAGYRTIHVGKGHFGPRDSPGADPTTLGFDVNVGGSSIGQPGSYYGRENFGARGKNRSHAVPHLERYHDTDTFLTEALTQEATRHVDMAIDANRPFFLHFAHYAVHAPFQADPRFAEHYRDSGKPAAAQAFATLVEGMDKSLGDLLDHLERRGVAERTLIFFLGDNGSDAPLGGPHEIGSSAPLRGRKGSHYEGGMRVPFIAAWAQPRSKSPLQARLPIAPNAVQTQLAAVYDLFPTILRAANVAHPEHHLIDGRPLESLLLGQRDPQRAETFLMHYPHAPHRSDYFTCYRRGPWKAIYHYFPSPASENSPYQLFHLERDPSESRNLASEAPEELNQLLREMAGALEQCSAVFPVGDDGQTRQSVRIPVANATSSVRLRVLSYNIHHGEGVDGKLDLERIARVIRSVEPDLVALQEVDRGAKRTGGVDQPEELARRTNLRVAFGPNIPLQGGHYGNAILSKHPLVKHSNHLLPNVDRSEQRGVLIAQVEVPKLSHPVTFFATHLDFRPDDRERLESVAAIRELLLKREPRLAILAGDMNAAPESPTLRKLAETWKVTNAEPLPTIPVDKPRQQIDFVLVHPAANWKLIETRVLDEPIASDHRPILAVIESP